MNKSSHDTRVFLVEGLPAAGKTTFSKKLHHHLTANGRNCLFFPEESSQPVDLFRQAVMTPDQYDCFIDRCQKLSAMDGSFSYDDVNEQLEKNLSLADGAYSFSVTTIQKSVFKKEESEIYSGKLVVGNPYDFNYRNAILKLKSASCWDWEKGVYNVLGLRDSMTRIVDLKYIDVSDAPAEEDGKCPHYQGTLQFWNTKQASWFFFCNDSSKTEFELINPIDIWLISEHFLAMYSVTGDAVYIDAGHGSILNKAERTLSRAEKEALQIPDKFEYEMVKNK